MEGLTEQVKAIAAQAKKDGELAKEVINKVYGSVLGDVEEHHGKVKAKFGKQSNSFSDDGKGWQVAGIAVLVLSFGFLFYSFGNIGSRDNGGIHRVR